MCEITFGIGIGRIPQNRVGFCLALPNFGHGTKVAPQMALVPCLSCEYATSHFQQLEGKILELTSNTAIHVHHHRQQDLGSLPAFRFRIGSNDPVVCLTICETSVDVRQLIPIGWRSGQGIVVEEKVIVIGYPGIC